MYKCNSLQEFQLPRAHLPFLQIFIITKYLKQEVDDDPSVCMDERSPIQIGFSQYKFKHYKQYFISENRSEHALNHRELCEIAIQT